MSTTSEHDRDADVARRRAVRPARRRMPVTSTGIVYLVLLLTIVVGAVLTASAGKSFFTSGNVSAILTGTSILGFIAVGQTLVILTGSLDLSVPYVISLASVVAAGTMDGQVGGIVPAVLLTLGLCVAIGLVNGFVVSVLRVHGFIATLGVGLVISGYLSTNYQGSHGSAPREFQVIGSTGVGPVPLSTILMLGSAVLVMLLLRRTRTGHQIYAVGGDVEVARMSGLRTARPVLVAHVLCSVLAGLAGLLLLARMSTGSPTIGEQGGYDLLSIAAVVLGGAVLAGGKGNVLGTIGGVAIFAVLNNVMSAIEINPFLMDTLRGAVIVIAVAVYARRTTRRPGRFERPSLTTAALENAR